MIKCAMFDLDGTLVNTIDDLARAADYTLIQYGVEPKWSVDDYLRFVGNGAKLLVSRAFENKLSDEELNRAFAIFKAKYNEILLDNAYVYDGIMPSLDAIKAQGVKLAVVTNKPNDAAVKIVETLFGEGCFECVYGAFEDKPKKPDKYLPSSALATVGAAGEESIFFGDSDVDVETARSVGAYAVSCSWGFRDRETLEKAHPDSIIDNPADIINFFKKTVDK